MQEDLFLRVPRLFFVRMTNQFELGKRPMRPSFDRAIVTFEVALRESIAEGVGRSSPSGITLVGQHRRECQVLAGRPGVVPV